MGNTSRAKASRKAAAQPDPKAFFSQAQVDAARSLTHGADSNRNPSAVLEAFVKGGESVQIAGLVFPPISLGRYLLLEAIDSPVLKPDGLAKIGNQQLAELIFVCSADPAEVRRLLAGPRDAYLERVLATADGIALPDLVAIGTAIGLRLAQAQATIISPASSGEGAGGGAEKKTAPLSASPKPATASAGG